MELWIRDKLDDIQISMVANMDENFIHAETNAQVHVMIELEIDDEPYGIPAFDDNWRYYARTFELLKPEESPVLLIFNIILSEISAVNFQCSKAA